MSLGDEVDEVNESGDEVDVINFCSEYNYPQVSTSLYHKVQQTDVSHTCV